MIVIGFELETYVFAEPPLGQTLRREMICIEVREGEVGTPLVIAPSWRPISATGKCDLFMLAISVVLKVLSYIIVGIRAIKE